MTLGVDGMRTSRVMTKAAVLTLGTLGFVFCLTLLFRSMRSVMDVGGSCASGGPYEISTPCPEGVAWLFPVSIIGMLISVGIGFLGVFPSGGPRPYVFAWSALFLALGWNFLEYGFDAPGGGGAVGWIICGVVFVVMGGAPLVLLKSGGRWALWGPDTRSPSPSPSLSLSPNAGGRYRFAGGLAGIPEQSAPAAPSAEASERMPVTLSDAMVERLERLAALHERGALDAREYEIAKDAILHDEVDE